MYLPWRLYTDFGEASGGSARPFVIARNSTTWQSSTTRYGHVHLRQGQCWPAWYATMPWIPIATSSNSSQWAYYSKMCDFSGSFAVRPQRKMWLQSINRFKDQGVMSPKNTARDAGFWPCETVATRTVVRGGFAAAADTRSVGAIPPPVAGGRRHGSDGG